MIAARPTTCSVPPIGRDPLQARFPHHPAQIWECSPSRGGARHVEALVVRGGLELPLTPTMTSRTCSPHISSAVDAAEEMARVAASRIDDVARSRCPGRLVADPDTVDPGRRRATRRSTLLVPI